MKHRFIILRGSDIFQMFADYMGNEVPADARFTGMRFNTSSKELSVVFETSDGNSKDLTAKCDLRAYSSLGGA